MRDVVERIQKWVDESGKKNPKKVLPITDEMMNELSEGIKPKFAGRLIRFDYEDGSSVIVVMTKKSERFNGECCYYRLFAIGDYTIKAMPIF